MIDDSPGMLPRNASTLSHTCFSCGFVLGVHHYGCYVVGLFVICPTPCSRKMVVSFSGKLPTCCRVMLCVLLICLSALFQTDQYLLT